MVGVRDAGGLPCAVCRRPCVGAAGQLLVEQYERAAFGSTHLGAPRCPLTVGGPTRVRVFAGLYRAPKRENVALTGPPEATHRYGIVSSYRPAAECAYGAAPITIKSDCVRLRDKAMTFGPRRQHRPLRRCL